MRRKQITSLLLSSILALSAMATPFTQLPVYAAEAESDAVETEEAGADAESDKSDTDASDAGAGEANGGNQTEGNQSDETGEASGGNSENGNSGTTDGGTVEDTVEDEDSGEVSGDNNTGDNTEAAEDEETVEDSEDEDGSVEDEEAAAGETKDEADGDFIFSGVVSVTTEGQEVVPEEKGGESPDDLFADYVEKSFNGELDKASSLKKRGAKSAGSNLSGIDRAIYNNISACLPQIAAGGRSSTVFEIFVDELGLEKTAWTAEELGIVSVLTLDENGNVALDENGYASISPEAVNAVSERTAFDLTKITRALLADNPYQLYWYEKTQSTTATGFQLTASYDNAIGDYLVGPVGSMSISFPVANEYSAGEYMVDTTIGQAVQTSVANANAIVSQYSSATDYDKLSGYKDEICDLVSYNEAAAGGGVSYGNPWQMIWVFDQDPTTNVVCEGYAKAFKYLCDQSEFSGDISCITVTGTMSGGTGEGPHMWNVVNMEDGKNYLVDVTNCDEGTIGAPDLLFLAGVNSGTVENGYIFRCIYELYYSDISYIYDESTFNLFNGESLTIADYSYQDDNVDPIDEPGIMPDPLDSSSFYYVIQDGGVIIENYIGGAINNLVIPENIEGYPVIKIGNGAFSGREDITGALYLPDSVETIGVNAFMSTGLQLIAKMPSNLKTIEEYAFGQNTSLRGSLILPSSTECIKDNAFISCGFDGTLQLNEGLIQIGREAFADCHFKGDLVIPSTVTEIGRSAFSGSWFDGTLKILSENIEEIPDKAFYRCQRLSEIELPNCIKRIGYEAFFQNYSLKGDLDLPNSVEIIEPDAFYYCGFDGELKLNEGIREIRCRAFYSCEFTSNLVLPSTLTFIGKSAFHWTKFSGALTLPEGIKHIGSCAFEATSLSGTVYIPNTVEYIGKDAFNSFYDLQVVNQKIYAPGFEFADLTHSIGETGYGVIDYNNALTEGLTLPQIYNDTPVVRVEMGAFYGCDNVTGQVVIPNGYRLLDTHAFANCTNITSISIPGTVDTIFINSFEGCSGLTEVFYEGRRAQAVSLAKDVLVLQDIVWHCSDGDIHSLINICSSGHSWDTEYTVDHEATCTEEGAESIHCSVCGVSDENTVRVIPAKGHTYGDWTVTKEATCTETGSKEKVCASCGDRVTEEIPATGHAYGEWTVVREATCTEAGSKEKICASCGDKITEVIPVTGHNWSEWTVVREATEDEEGLERRTCSNDSSHTEERIIPKLTHVHELTKTEAKEASCTEDGNIEFWTCSKCGRVYSDSEGVNEVNLEETVIHATGHKWNTEYTVDNEATCTEEGSESIHCSVCGVSDENSVQVISATGHAYGEWTVTKEATCAEAGSREKVCANCGDKVTEEIPATGHSYGEWTVTKEATCTEAGSREKVCANCGDKVTEEILAIGHLWDSEYTVDKEATCTEEGSESIHCSVCGMIDENSVQAVPKKEHTYGDWTVTKEATCTEAGSREKVCANCGDKITEEIPATGHAWSEWTVVREATEEEEGLERRTCSNDPSHTEERIIPTLTHVHELIKTEAKEASCTEDGNIEFWTCSKCGRVYSDSEGVNEIDSEETVIHATGHKWNSEYTVDKEATCTEEGSESIHCSVCGVIDENTIRVIPATGHSYGDWTVTKEATCTEAGSKEKVCASCGDKITESIPATGHSYGDWTVTKEATCTEAGSKEKVCANCGDKITEEIPAKGHAYGDWTVTKEATCTEAGSKEKVCANCGDKVTEEIPAGHQWNESYTVDVAPTYTEEGVESIHCSVCGEIKEGSERAVAKLRKPVSMLEISGIVDKNYNGKAQTQAVVVRDGDTTLVNGTDYTLLYMNNTNAGTASVVITGEGNYKGSVTKNFTIKKIANTISAKSFTKVYSTKAQVFALGVKIKNGTPTYKSNSKYVVVSKAGKVTVKAKFIGKATITITAPASTNYTATTKKITVTVVPTKTALVSVTSPSAGKMIVNWKKNAVGTGYLFQYSTSSKFEKPKTVTITKNTILTKTIGSLVKGKKYYVRIRTYKTVGSAKFYSGWSAVKAVTIRK